MYISYSCQQEKSLKQWFSTAILCLTAASSGDIWQQLETILVVTKGIGVGMILQWYLSGSRPGKLRAAPHDRIIQSRMSTVPRLRNPDLKRTCSFLLKYKFWRKAWIFTSGIRKQFISRLFRKAYLSSWMVNDSNQDAHLYLLKIRQDYSKQPPYTFTLPLPK